MPVTLAQLNAADVAHFTATLGHLFEHSPWVGERTWPHRPFTDTKQLHAALCATMHAATPALQLALIRAHPDLAGRLAQLHQLTAESTREQASAGLDRLEPEQLAEFNRLNTAYTAKFGFPFIICARLNARAAILAAMRTRSDNPPDTEFATALVEVEKIAWLRLQDTVSR
ncbi:MAG: 2-oxo-4-hydroxy-4-carboxy-5-ureidoimidazoline decarboxylase [Verrucomicrobiota bacterium]|jgi:2-oxo-4-hydroxy-4-carboxy-5-ureidoimidazoline decarboxylase